ncbi:unnamed protein product, partial [Prorocentrum cordatum]
MCDEYDTYQLRAWFLAVNSNSSEHKVRGEMQWGATCDCRCLPTLLLDGAMKTDVAIRARARQLRRQMQVMCSCPEAESFSWCIANNAACPCMLQAMTSRARALCGAADGACKLLRANGDEQQGGRKKSEAPAGSKSSAAQQAERRQRPRSVEPTRRATPRRGAKGRNWGTRDHGLKELPLLPSMPVAQLTQRSRAMWGVTASAVFVEEKDSVVVAMPKEPRAIRELTAGLRQKIGTIKDGAMGAKGSRPNLEKLANNQALVRMEMCRQLREYIESVLVTLEDEPPARIRFCRMESCMGEGMLKIVFALDDRAMEVSIT